MIENNKDTIIEGFNADEAYKISRLYVDQPFKVDTPLCLSAAQAHYLKNVVRRQEGDWLRVFNGRDGEWLARLNQLSKKNADTTLIKCLIEQPEKPRALHLYFTPIKKHRLDWLIEKAVELGASDLHPILTQNTQMRKIKPERIEAQIFEAAEQCERLEIPRLHGLKSLEDCLPNEKDALFFSCLERFDAPNLGAIAPKDTDKLSVLIGPEGGFTSEEKELIARKTTPVDLGETILRVETAAIKALILLQNAS